MVGNILGWVKANLMIVISCALILILLPVGWFFSSGWNQSISEKASEAYKSEDRRLKGASTIEYSLPAVLAGEEAISERRAPNSIVTQFYAKHKEQREQQVAEIVERGTGFNQADHSVPVDGLLPEAKDDRELRSNGFLLGEIIAGTEESPSIYAKLLRKLNAGDVSDPETLTTELNQFKAQQQEAYAATSSDGKMSAEQSKKLDQDLIKKRLGQYAGQAESIAFYCSLSAIQTEQPEAGFSHIPAMTPGYDAINETTVFTWVWDYWVVSDVLRAVSLANTGADGVSLAVPLAPVKHIERITVNELAAGGDSDSDVATDDPGGYQPGGRYQQPRGSSSSSKNTESIEVNSYTNRTGGTSGSAYDIRYANITLIASSEDLPAFFEALGQTNYMTVIDVDLSQVDVHEALAQGYYYGDDHLVRADITIESIWLRSWTAPIMPKQVRTTLGVTLESDNADDYDG